ncbi:hypothetical protein [Mucilaginibacter sp.]|jgi:hypothetical protein|uniref:hypothetical protein n=1 Tax=Mucilaginibacter sp. TaxID=1882438 RepID=UPI002BB76C3F|nr:hypothetical protein [Mucilaginibacter sp.]HTI60382.1 hypothetical protein [Mucilaginibacter sp.]
MLLREFDLKLINILGTELIGQPVSNNSYNILIKESSFINLEKHKPIVYLDLNHQKFDELVPLLEKLEFQKSTRKTLGDRNESILFGAVTAKINHDNFCNVGATILRSPKLNQLLKIKYSTIANEIMKTYLEQWQKIGMSVFKKSGIHTDWQMADTFWTSGIINKNSPHNFHLDNDNSRNGYSAMITLKHNMSGGYIVFPEYALAVEVSNRSLIFFCGKDIVHGVSDINLKKGGFRYSMVYYTTADLKYCDSYANEMKKAEI